MSRATGAHQNPGQESDPEFHVTAPHRSARTSIENSHQGGLSPRKLRITLARHCQSHPPRRKLARIPENSPAHPQRDGSESMLTKLEAHTLSFKGLPDSEGGEVSKPKGRRFP